MPLLPYSENNNYAHELSPQFTTGPCENSLCQPEAAPFGHVTLLPLLSPPDLPSFLRNLEQLILGSLLVANNMSRLFNSHIHEENEYTRWQCWG